MTTTSVCSSHLHALSLEDVATLAQRCGYDGLDISADLFAKGPPPHIVIDDSADLVARSTRSLVGVSRGATSLSANTYLVRDDPQQAAIAKEHVRCVIDLAQALRIPFVHVFTGRAPPAVDSGAAWQQLAEVLGALCEYASTRGVHVGIEGCVVHFVRSLEEHRRLFAMLPGVDLRVCFDPSHLYLHGESVFEAAEILLDRISLVHVKDAAGTADSFSLPPLGQGDMPWPEMLHQLQAHGYRGGYALEYEGRGYGWREDDEMILLSGRTFLREHGI